MPCTWPIVRAGGMRGRQLPAWRVVCVMAGMLGKTLTVDAPPPLLMVVDDDADLLWLMRGALVRSGFAVQVSTHAPTLQAVRDAHPAALVLDLEIGQESGEEVCREVKQASDLVGLPVLLISGKPGAALHGAAAQCGADAVLAKPFRLRELVQMAGKLLHRPAA